MKEYFNTLGITTLVFIVLTFYFIVRTLRKKEVNWGKAILFGFFFGLFICILAALRDGYGFSDNAMIEINSSLSSILSIFGFILFILAITSVFLKGNKYRKLIFILMVLTFIIKFVIVEYARIVYIF